MSDETTPSEPEDKKRKPPIQFRTPPKKNVTESQKSPTSDVPHTRRLQHVVSAKTGKIDIQFRDENPPTPPSTPSFDSELHPHKSGFNDTLNWLIDSLIEKARDFFFHSTTSKILRDLKKGFNTPTIAVALIIFVLGLFLGYEMGLLAAPDPQPPGAKIQNTLLDKAKK